jgi:YihY family inner membrane protein
MSTVTQPSVLLNPLAPRQDRLRAFLLFTWDVLRSFRANQGLLLAGAVAYYTLLSLVPLLILTLIGLSHFIAPSRLLATLHEYLEFLVPGQSEAFVAQLQAVLAHREAVGGVLVVTMLIFSAMAFTVLENAMSVVFFHRVSVRRRHFFISALLPYVFILLLGIGLLAATVVSGKLGVLATREVALFGVPRSLEGLSTYLLYLMGVAGEVLVVTAIYLVMPVGRIAWRHALVGGVVACALWEATRHILVWYYETLSQIQVVYGSFATTVAVLLSVEIAAIVLLLGAQVIANYERLERTGSSTVEAVPKLRTD